MCMDEAPTCIGLCVRATASWGEWQNDGGRQGVNGAAPSFVVRGALFPPTRFVTRGRLNCCGEREYTSNRPKL